MSTITAPPANPVAYHVDPESFGGPLVVACTDSECPVAQAVGEPFNPEPGLDIVSCNVCVRGERFSPIRHLPHGGGVEIEALDTEMANADAVERSRQIDGPPKSPAQRMAECAEWLADLPRKVEIVDVTHARRRCAELWLRSYSGDFKYLVDMKAKRGVRSVGQAKGVLNCWRAELRSGRRPAAAVPARPVDASALAAVNAAIGA